MGFAFQCLALVSLSLATSATLTVNAVAQSSPPSDVSPDFPEIIDPTIPPSPQQPAPEPPSPIPDVPLEIPPTPQPSECLSSSSDERFFIKTITVEGNTVLQREIEQLIEPFENREVAFEDLICLRSQITDLYIRNGYINSGAFLPDNQDISTGVVVIQVVEGEIESIEISGLRRLRSNYVRSRLQLATGKPLNQQRLQEALELLQLNPLIRRVNAELTAGSTPGKSILLVTLEEAPAFHAGIGFDNYRPPSIGSEQGTVFISHDNLLGFGDRGYFEYDITGGLDRFDVRYVVPLNARDGTLSLEYENYESTIIDNQIQRRNLDIRSETESFYVNFRQPIFQSPESEFALGIGFDVRRNQTFLNDIPFSFSFGSDDGESKVTAIRLFQDWIKRTPSSVIAVRSQFSIGIDAFGATINDTGTDGRFFAWLGQFQWVQQVSPSTLFLLRFDAQLTPDSLLALERFSLGGIDTIRGYLNNQLVTDNGIFGSAEFRIALTSDPRIFQLTPFIDFGTGWNNETVNPDPATLVGVGLGFRWLVTQGLSLRLDYGVPLISVGDRGDSLQGQGFYFSVRYQPF